MQVEDCFGIGRVLRPHGVKGALRIRIDSDNPEAYLSSKKLYFQLGLQLVPYNVQSVDLHSGSEAFLQLSGIENRTDAEKFTGSFIFLPLELLPELSGDRFYYHEIVGYTISDENLGMLGRVSGVTEMPGQDLVVMHYKGHEVLIPLTEETVLKADRENRLLLTRLPDGLLEIYLE